MALLPATAWALDYRSVSAEKAILYDAPSTQGKKLFIVRQYYPVEIIVDLGEWIKVRDSRGELAWIEARNLAAKREVEVTAAQAEVRESANADARLVFLADKAVVLELLEPASNGWAKVRHRDGLTGYIQTSKVWGL
ncbi:MAG TPA: SH3 domain-containing protein [Methylophilaceae bacterium]|nr:SH3 domain-containing protein [Methylophilaceae bacterium]